MVLKRLAGTGKLPKKLIRGRFVVSVRLRAKTKIPEPSAARARYTLPAPTRYQEAAASAMAARAHTQTLACLNASSFFNADRLQEVLRSRCGNRRESSQPAIGDTVHLPGRQSFGIVLAEHEAGSFSVMPYALHMRAQSCKLHPASAPGDDCWRPAFPVTSEVVTLDATSLCVCALVPRPGVHAGGVVHAWQRCYRLMQRPSVAELAPAGLPGTVHLFGGAARALEALHSSELVSVSAAVAGGSCLC